MLSEIPVPPELAAQLAAQAMQPDPRKFELPLSEIDMRLLGRGVDVRMRPRMGELERLAALLGQQPSEYHPELEPGFTR